MSSEQLRRAVRIFGSAGRARRAWALVYLAILVTGVLLGLQIVTDGYSPVPYGDLWAQFSFIERGVRGEVALGDLWAQWNEHRILVARLQFLLDYGLLDGTNVFLFAVTTATCLLLAATCAAATWLETQDWLLALGTLAVAGASVLPLAGTENLLLAFNVHFVQTFLFAAVSILAVVVAARSRGMALQATFCGMAALAAAAATYSTANGPLTWAVVVTLALVLSFDRRLTAALVAVGVVTLASFFWRFELSEGRTLSDPIGLTHFVLLYLGSAPTPSSGTAAIAGAAGLVVFAALCRLCWMHRSRRSILVPFGAGLAAFAVLTAGVTAVGRLGFGVSQALGSRYSIGSFTFLLGLFVGFLPLVRANGRTAEVRVPALLALAAALALVLGYAARPSESELREWVAGKQAAVVAHLAGVEDPANERFIRAGLLVTPVFRWMERERLGPWAPGGMVEGMQIRASIRATDRPCLGEIESARGIRGGVRLAGRIAAPDGEAGSPHLVVLDSAGHRVGLGLVGAVEDDEQPVRGDGRFVAYVGGRTISGVEVTLLAPDRATAVCRLSRSDGGRG